MIVIKRLLTFDFLMDILIPVLLLSLISSPLVETLHAPINTTRSFTPQPPPSFQKQVNFGAKKSKVFSFSGNANAGVAPPLPPQPKTIRGKAWNVRNSYQIQPQGVFQPNQQRKPNVPPSFQRNNQPNSFISQTFNANQVLQNSGFPPKQPFIVTTPVPTPSPDSLGGAQVRFNFKVERARQAQLARMRTTSPKPSPTAKSRKKPNNSQLNRFNGMNRFRNARINKKPKEPAPTPEKQYVSGNGVQYTDLSKIAKDGSYMGNQDPLYVYSTTTAPPPTYPPTQPPYRQPYRNNYQNNYYQTTTYGYQYYQTTNNYNYDPYYQGQYQGNNSPYQGNNAPYQGNNNQGNNQQYQGNYPGYATTTPYYQEPGYQGQGQYNQGYQNQGGYQYTTPPYYPPVQQNNQGYQNNYGPPSGPPQGGGYPQNTYTGNQTYSNYNYPQQGANTQYTGQGVNNEYISSQQNQAPYQQPSGNAGPNAQYQPPPVNQGPPGPNAQYQPPPVNQGPPGPNAQYQPPSANQGPPEPNAQYQPPPANQGPPGPNAQYQPPPANQGPPGPNAQYQPPPANQGPPGQTAQYQTPPVNQGPPGNPGPNAPYQPPSMNQGPPGNQGPNPQYQSPPGNQGPNPQYQSPPGSQGPNSQYQRPPENQGVNANYQVPPNNQMQNAQYQPPPGGQGSPPMQGQPPPFSQGQGIPPVPGQSSYQGQGYPQGNPSYQTSQQNSQLPPNTTLNKPYQYQPGQGFNDNYIPPKNGGAAPSKEQKWVRIDNFMTTIKPPNNERWVQVGSIKPTWTTQSTLTVNQNKKVQEVTTKAPPDVAGWSDPAPNPNEINLEITGDTLIDIPIEVTKSLDNNSTSKRIDNSSAKTSDSPTRGDIQIINKKEKLSKVPSSKVKDRKAKPKEIENIISISDTTKEKNVSKTHIGKNTDTKDTKIVPEKTEKNTAVSKVSKSDVKSKRTKLDTTTKKTPKSKSTTTSSTTTTTTTTTTPKTTTTTTTTTTPKPTTPKPTTTTSKPTTTTPKPTTTTTTTTTTTPKPTTPKPTTTTPKPTTRVTTTSTKSPSTTTMPRPETPSKQNIIQNLSGTQLNLETKSQTNGQEKISKEKSTQVKPSRKPPNEMHTNKVLSGKDSVTKTDLLDNTKNLTSRDKIKNKTNQSRKSKISKISGTSEKESRLSKNSTMKSITSFSKYEQNSTKRAYDKDSSLKPNSINKIKKSLTSSKSVEEMKIQSTGRTVNNTLTSVIDKISDTTKDNTNNNVVMMDAELVRSFVKLIEHFTSLTQPVLTARQPLTGIIGPLNTSDISSKSNNSELRLKSSTRFSKTDDKQNKMETIKKRRLPPSEFIKELASGPSSTPKNIQIIRLSKMEREAQNSYAQRLEKTRMDQLRRQHRNDFENKLNAVKQDPYQLDPSLLFASHIDNVPNANSQTKGAIDKLQLNVKSSSIPESLDNVLPLPEVSTPPPIPLDLDLLSTQFVYPGEKQQNNFIYPMQMRETIESQIIPQIPSTTPDIFSALDGTGLFGSHDVFNIQPHPVGIDDNFLHKKENPRMTSNSRFQSGFQHVDTSQTETIYTLDGKPIRTKTKLKHSFRSNPVDLRKRNKFLHDERVKEASKRLLRPEKNFGHNFNANTRGKNTDGIQQNILATLPPTFDMHGNIRKGGFKSSHSIKLSDNKNRKNYDVPQASFRVGPDAQGKRYKQKIQNINDKIGQMVPLGAAPYPQEQKNILSFQTTNIGRKSFESQRPIEIQDLKTGAETTPKRGYPVPLSKRFQGIPPPPQPISMHSNPYSEVQGVQNDQRGLLNMRPSKPNNQIQTFDTQDSQKIVIRQSESSMTPIQNQEKAMTFTQAELLEFLRSGIIPTGEQQGIKLNYQPQPSNPIHQGRISTVSNKAAVKLQNRYQNRKNIADDMQTVANNMGKFENINENVNFQSSKINVLVNKNDALVEKTLNGPIQVDSLKSKTFRKQDRHGAPISTDSSNIEENNKPSNKMALNRQVTETLNNIRERQSFSANKKESLLARTNAQPSTKNINYFFDGNINELVNKGRLRTSEYIEQLNTKTKNQASSKKTTQQLTAQKPRRKIIIKYDTGPVIVRKTLVKKIKYVKRKDNLQNQTEIVTQTPPQTSTKMPEIETVTDVLQTVTKSPLEIIAEAKKPSTSLLKKFEQMKYLINLIEKAEKEKLNQSTVTINTTTVGTIENQNQKKRLDQAGRYRIKTMNATAVKDQKRKKLEEKSSKLSEIIRNNQTEKLISSKGIKEIQNKMGQNVVRKFPKEKTEQVNRRSYTLSTPAFGTGRETRTYLSNHKSVPVFHLPRKKFKESSQKTDSVKIIKEKKDAIKSSSDTKTTKIERKLKNILNNKTFEVYKKKEIQMTGSTMANKKSLKTTPTLKIPMENTQKNVVNKASEVAKSPQKGNHQNMSNVKNNAQQLIKKGQLSKQPKTTEAKQKTVVGRTQTKTKLAVRMKNTHSPKATLKFSTSATKPATFSGNKSFRIKSTNGNKDLKSKTASSKVTSSNVTPKSRITKNNKDFSSPTATRVLEKPEMNSNQYIKKNMTDQSINKRLLKTNSRNEEDLTSNLASRKITPVKTNERSFSTTANRAKSKQLNKNTKTAQLMRKMGISLSKTSRTSVRKKKGNSSKKIIKINNVGKINKQINTFTRSKNEGAPSDMIRISQPSKTSITKSNFSQNTFDRKVKHDKEINTPQVINDSVVKQSNKNSKEQVVRKNITGDVEIASSKKNIKYFPNNLKHNKASLKILSPFSTNKFSVKTSRNSKNSAISFSPVLKAVVKNTKKLGSIKISAPHKRLEQKVEQSKGYGMVSQSLGGTIKSVHFTPSPLLDKTIKVQNMPVKFPNYQSSASRSQRTENLNKSSSSKKEKLASKFRRPSPIRNLTAEENELLLTQNHSLMNSVEPSNRHILVKILQFLYSNSSDQTSLETIKQEILSTTSKDQQIIIFDILAAYLGGTPPDNSYLVAKARQTAIQTSPQRGVHIQQKPVLKDSHRFGPRQDHRGQQRQAKASAVDFQGVNSIGTTVYPSDLTTLPTYPTTKSFWDSLFSFTPTTPFPGRKPGSCPTAFALMFDCQSVCSHDSHCYGRQKCCHGGRGTGCCAQPESMDVGFNNLLMPYMMAESQGQGQGQNNRFFGEMLKKK